MKQLGAFNFVKKCVRTSGEEKEEKNPLPHMRTVLGILPSTCLKRGELDHDFLTRPQETKIKSTGDGILSQLVQRKHPATSATSNCCLKQKKPAEFRFFLFPLRKLQNIYCTPKNYNISYLLKKT